MKKLILTSFVLALFAGQLIAQTQLTDAERKAAIENLNNSQNELLKAVKGLSTAQLNYKSSPDAWSISECMEHITISENNIFGMAQMSLQEAANPERRAEVNMSDEQVLGLITSREQKIKTQTAFEPTNSFGSYKGALDAFKAKRTSNIDFVKTTTEDLRNRYAQFPFGVVDTYQVILFMSGHTSRHTDQIKEVIASANFPK